MPGSVTGRTLASAVLAVTVTLLTATAVLAAPHPGPDPGDPRAVAHDGNVTSCAQAGLPGTTLTSVGMENAGKTTVTVTVAEIPPGETILAVVVKGGPGYNVYQGLTEWTDLHSPLNPGGNIPQVSHWFVCVGSGSTTTTTSTTSATVTTAPRGGGTTTTTSTTTSACDCTSSASLTSASVAVPPSSRPSSSVVTTASTVVLPVAGHGGGGALARTGFGDSWLVWAGLLTLLAGAGVLTVSRLARRRS